MRKVKKDKPSIFRVFIIYKNKIKKVRPINSNDLNGDISNGLED
jgi:hypothetical protein